ncbi:MAG: glycosyltransferase family 2 protein, partial [Candidatus Uhrbacteria bacterium]|nr:glycosyltransferase family 2 protein [Candidatus Uhrbacteria bacterium]
VVIPTYQHARSLPGCLDSVLKQQNVRTEIIVVNDGSTDNTEEVLAPYRNRAHIITQQNQGGNPARNRGLAEAKGEFIIFCDADAVMRPDMLAKMLAMLQAHPDASIAYSGFYFGWKHFPGVPWNADRLRRVNFIHTTSLVRRADFPGFDNAVRRFQDWDVWLTMLEQGKSAVLVPETLFLCVIDGESRTGSSWLPSFVYRLPWKFLGWKPERVAKYELAREVIVKKHKLEPLNKN